MAWYYSSLSDRHEQNMCMSDNRALSSGHMFADSQLLDVAPSGGGLFVDSLDFGRRRVHRPAQRPIASLSHKPPNPWDWSHVLC